MAAIPASTQDAQVQYERATNAPGDEGDDIIQAAEIAAASGAPYIHPEAVALFARCPWTEKVPIFGVACRGYGPKMTIALGIIYFLSKGLGNNFLSQARYPMFTNRFGIDATRYQRLSAIAGLGSSIKALIAMISDSIAIFGYTKRWYCAGSCVLGAVMTLVYATLPTKPSSADVAAGFSFLASFSIMNIDILSEGHYSRLMRKIPQSGPALISWMYWFILSAALVVAAIQGPVSDSKKPQIGLFISAGAQIIPVVFFILNWYGERTNRVERYEDARRLHEELSQLRAAADAKEAAEPIKDYHPEKDMYPEEEGSDNENRPDALREEMPQASEAVVGAVGYDDDFPPPRITSCCCGAVEINGEVAKRNWRVLSYSIVMTLIVVVIMLVTIFGDSWALLYTACVVLVVGCSFGFFALPFAVAKANVFIYLHLLTYLQLPGALNSFYLATPECLPDGPHFTYTFYNTIASIIGNICGIAGVTCFNYFFAKRSYRFTFMATTSVQILASLFDIIIVKRWNVHIGIPDHAMYLFGDAVVYEVVYYIAWMPMVMLLSRICPRGSESMVYALVAGFGNLGSSMSSTIGSLLMELVWPIDTKSRPCDFSNLVILLVVGHLCLPCIVYPSAFLLLPAARMCDDIDVDGHTIKAQHAAEVAERDGSEDGGIVDSDDAPRRRQS